MDEGRARKIDTPGERWQLAWIRESAVLLLSSGLGIVATGVLAILVARHLGPRSLGVFASFYGLAQAFGVVVDFGLATWLLRGLTATGGQPDRSLGRAFELSSWLGAGLLAASAGVSVLAQASVEMTLVLVSLVGYSVLAALAVVLETVFRAQRRVGLVATATILEKGGLLALVGAAVLLGGGLTEIALGYLLAGAARLVFSLVNTGRSGVRNLRFAGPRSLWRTIVEVAPFTFSVGGVVLITRFDIVIIGAVSTLAAGYYAIGERVSALLMLLPLVASSALYPHLGGGRRRDIWRIAAPLVAVSVVLAVAMIFTCAIWLPAVFGSAYTGAVPTVRLLLASTPAISLAAILIASLNTEHREGDVARWTALTVLPGTALVLIGLLLLGPAGAAAGFLVRVHIFTGALVRLHRHVDRARGVASPAGGLG